MVHGVPGAGVEPIGLLNRLALRRDLTSKARGADDERQWLGVAFGLGVTALGLVGFFRGLSLPPNSPEHRSRGSKGSRWRT